ncbi:MraY family glycosyltransferase [Hufsiella ginkgonis]|uniref:Undecaprenyl/decaprenyl-phosphate alpha-N-acetylglucosaminyl 1-phosphate transferase n=1 Tax=Hufsiella ginkgonis TaxID=2695274 RepID=A0A7K1Y271_9SPHI|nr:MraY family glycosyltransferase [Hufsiella ginkgonis]MXV17373.1 undecaprenyl/decaprenyl-phosphate alpha-N-acetylglucosaminyl 1-phosphate transferase [Hufsiella ginkgonis]
MLIFITHMNMINLLGIFFSAFVVAAIVVPVAIETAYKRRLFDVPTESRKVHKRIIPNLGGIAIFAGFMFTQQLFIRASMIPCINQILMCGTLLFMLGLKDDIVGLTPFKKFIAQFAAASIVAIIGDIRIIDLNGIMGLYQLSYPFSISLSVFAIVGIVNSFNLIDGVDGLAGCLGVVMTFMFAFLFYKAGETGWCYLALASAGSIIGFLLYNMPAARIFMGDSGSLLIGFLVVTMSIHFVNIAGKGTPVLGSIRVVSPHALVLALLIIPLFDTLRVFTIRILANTSPFKADRNHLHHRLLAVGMSHLQVTITLCLITVGFVALTLYLQKVGDNQLIATIMMIVFSLNTGFTLYLASVPRDPEAVLSAADTVSPPSAKGKRKGSPKQRNRLPREDFADEVIKKIYRN